MLNLELCSDPEAAQLALAQLAKHARVPFAVQVDGSDGEFLASVTAEPVPGLDAVLITAHFCDEGGLSTAVQLIHARGLRAIAVVTSLDAALLCESAGFDGLIAKGNESGGWVSEETAFVLAQRLAGNVRLPVWLQGGIGLYTSAAAEVAGLAGVVLDSQLLLAREARLPETLQSRLTTMDGSETEVVGADHGARFRCYSRQDSGVAGRLRNLRAQDLSGGSPSDVRRAWRHKVIEETWSASDPLWSLGQDAGFAAPLAARFKTVGGIIAAVEASMTSQAELAQQQRALGPGSSLSNLHRTAYPVVQGPMTRVSDRAAFTRDVAEAGGLPFIALALMKADEIEPLLQEAKQLLGERSWGVGILGFVPPDLRREQLDLLRKYRPPFALIAGGRPDHAKSLEADGISTYLHVPSPGLLRMFLADGARKFVLEGRECGGHIGPRSSLVLWNSAVSTLLEYLDANPRTEGLQVLFAGGVHDGLSAAMVAAVGAPLVERGVSIGVLCGTAYLFTEEAVQSGAIGSSFQDAAIESSTTIVLESAPGYATRCLPSPFADVFTAEKQRLVAAGASVEQIKDDLELLNIGRLRIASKGVTRHPDYGKDPAAPRMTTLLEADRWEQGMYMIGQVAALRGRTCTVAELHEEISAGSVRHLAAIDANQDEAGESPPPCAVAIVGMSSIVPGASDLETFWRNILNKVDAISEVPADRWDAGAYFDEDKAARDKIYSRWGGFIDEVPFDPVEFGMPPSSLRSIEPFQLLALLMVRDALKDAGYDTRPFNRERTSVILGAGGGTGDLGNGYVVRSNLPRLFGDRAEEVADLLEGVLPEWTEDSFAGLLMNVAAGRIANRFDFGGVNYTVDAACASSLTAVYLAVRDLEARTSDTVVVGGVDAIQSPFGFLCFSKTQALSPTGRSRPFDVDADGIAISEGFASLVLKRLEDAERDGDRIYAVIRGVGGSSDGRARGLTAPRPEGQVRALRRAYGNAGFSASTVGLIEAHGTGTVAGDRSELASLTMLFGESGAQAQSVAVGSVKSMIGHTKATAGVAGLIKIVKALYHRVLPPTIGVETPNPQVNSEGSPFYVSTEARPWLQPDGSQPRRAGVSGFGFGGTNFHVVVEEYTGEFQERLEPATGAWDAELFVVRGSDRAALLVETRKLASQLDTDAEPKLADLAYTINRRAGLTGGGAVLSLVASGREELLASLQEAIALLEKPSERAHTPKGIHFSDAPLAADGKTAFLFPGQGSQYLNMGKDLAVLFPRTHDALQHANDVLAGLHQKPLAGYIYPPPWFGKEEQKVLDQALTSTNVAQPALGAVETAMLGLLRQLGVDAEMSAGHSYGEFVALHFAGACSHDDLLRLSEARGRFMNESTGEESGTMAAILAPMEDVAKVLAAFPDVTPANLNAPKQTVVSGTREAIAKAIAWCGEQGINARQLPVACAFHSSLVAPAAEKLLAFMQGIEFQAPRSTVFSNTTAGAYPSEPDAIRQRLADHLISPVRFVEQVNAMYEAGARIFVEVGPRQVMSGLVDQILDDQPHVAVPLDNPNKPGLWSFLNGIAALVSEGIYVNLDRLYEGRVVSQIDLANLPAAMPKYSPTTWLVDGGRARPASEAVRQPRLPLQVRFGDQPVPPASSPPSTPGIAAPVAPTQSLAMPPAPATTSMALSTPAVAPEAGRAGVMAHFQDVMTHFLYTQEAMLHQLYAARNGHAGLASPTNEASPTNRAHPAVPPSTPDVVAAPASTGPSAPAVTKRYIPTLRDSAVTGEAGLNRDGAVLLVGGSHVAEALSGLLASEGYKTCAIETKSHNQDGGGFHLSPDAGEQEVGRLLDAVRTSFGAISAVVYLDGLSGDEGPAASLDHGARGLFWLAKLTAPDLQQSAAQGGAAFLGVTAIDGGFGMIPGSAPALGSRLWVPGFVKSLSYEWPEVRVRAVDLASREAETAARSIRGELLADSRDREAAYDSAGTRRTLVLEADYKEPQASPAPGSDSVVLVTGGARGITAACAIGLAHEVPGTYVLAGRTPLREGPEDEATRGIVDERELKSRLLQKLRAEDAPVTPKDIERAYARLMGQREVEATLQGLTATGARVVYEACDISDSAAFERLVASVYERFGRIDGVVHGAGVIEDRLLADKTIDSFERVMATKLRPLEVLVEALRPESLRFLALFSSVTARTGNRGQVDYAAANEVMNKVAGSLAARWSGRVVAMNWGPWQGAGMVSPEVERQFKERGIGLIPLGEGVASFVREVLAAEGPAEVVIGALDEAVKAMAAPTAVAPRQASALLGGATVTGGTEEGLTVRQALPLAVHRYLEDHLLDGKPVVPFAFAMELMTEAGNLAAPEDMRVAAIKDVRVFRGLILEGDGIDVEIDVQTPAGANGHGPSARATIQLADKEQAPSYRATLEYASATGHILEDAGPSPLAGIEHGPPSFTLDAAYRDWLFHGPAFRAIESIETFGPAGASAMLRPSDAAELLGRDAGAWQVDPLLIDAAFQLQLIWGRVHWDVTLLPSSVTRLTVFEAPGDGEAVRCEMRIRRAANTPICHSDFWFYAQDGRLLARLEDFESSGTRALNRLALKVKANPGVSSS